MIFCNKILLSITYFTENAVIGKIPHGKLPLWKQFSIKTQLSITFSQKITPIEQIFLHILPFSNKFFMEIGANEPLSYRRHCYRKDFPLGNIVLETENTVIDAVFH